MGDRGVRGSEPERSCRAVEQGTEHAGRVGAGQAQPLDGTVRGYQATVLTVGEKGVVGDRRNVLMVGSLLVRKAGAQTARPMNLCRHRGYRSPPGGVSGCVTNHRSFSVRLLMRRSAALTIPHPFTWATP